MSISSKVLIIYTSHRQLEEIKLSTILLSRTSFLQKCDLLFHCNKIDLDVKDYFELFPNTKKELIHTSKNTGYTYGAHEALADLYPKYKDYDFVIHLHPDIFIIDEKVICDIILKHKDTEEVFICTRNTPEETYTSFDFFIFKPQKLPCNIFKNWESSSFRNDLDPERLLFKMITTYKLPYVVLKRFDNDWWHPRRTDLLGLWHEHDITNIIKYLEDTPK